mgnify:CR=1 FL=1
MKKVARPLCLYALIEPREVLSSKKRKKEKQIRNGREICREKEELSIVDSVGILAFVPRTRYSHSHNRSRYNLFIGYCISVKPLTIDRRCEISYVTVIFIVIALCCLSLIVTIYRCVSSQSRITVFIDTRSRTVDVDVCHNRHPLLSLIKRCKIAHLAWLYAKK